MAEIKSIIKALPGMEPKTCIPVTKEQAKQVSIGDRVEISVEGEVSGVHERYDGGGYDLELKTPNVSGIKGNQADKAYKEMKGEQPVAQIAKAVGKEIAKKIEKPLSKNPADFAWDEVKD